MSKCLKSCMKSQVSCSYSVGAIICGLKSVAWHHLLIERLPRWFFKPLFHWVWELDVFSVIKEKQLQCKHSCVSTVYKGSDLSLICIFLAVGPSRPRGLLKILAHAVQTQTRCIQLSSISALTYSISLRAHFYAWFKHPYRKFLCPHSAQENHFSERWMAEMFMPPLKWSQVDCVARLKQVRKC